MKQLTQQRMQAAIELLDHLIRKELEEGGEKYRSVASLDLAQVNEVLVVAGTSPIKVDEKKEVEVISCDNE